MSTPTRLRRLFILEWDLTRWRDRINAATETTHTRHHASPEYPADWERCWGEPCRDLAEVAREISDELDEA